MVRIGLFGLFVVALFVAGAASAGSTMSFVNETMADSGLRGDSGNLGTLKDLMEGGSQRQAEFGGTLEECLDAVMRLRLDRGSFYPTSVPDGSIAPGAQEWCECIVGDTVASLADLNLTIDRCRGLVLDGSDFKTVDMCRGMVGFVGFDNRQVVYDSFCGSFCSDVEGLRPGGYSLVQGCNYECAREAMPGYCSKYVLTYGPWKYVEEDRMIRYCCEPRRDVVVNNEYVARQVSGGGYYSFVARRANAREICKALQPFLGSYNACCNYPRGFEALQICCAADENGKGVFDCDNHYGGSNIYWDCLTNSGILPFKAGCRNLIQAYQQSPDYGSAKLFTNNISGTVLIMFPESTIEALDTEYEYYELLNTLANYYDPSTITYKGPAFEPISGPIEPADSGEEPEDPCMGTCEGDRQCVTTQTGRAFCVECSALLRESAGEEDAECCSYDETTLKCVSALTDSSLGDCRRSEDIFLVEDDGDRVTASFKSSRGFVCDNPRNFRRNGKGCRVRLNSDGVAKCVERR